MDGHDDSGWEGMEVDMRQAYDRGDDFGSDGWAPQESRSHGQSSGRGKPRTSPLTGYRGDPAYYSSSYIRSPSNQPYFQDSRGDNTTYVPAKPGETHRVSVGFGQTLVKMAREAWGAARPAHRPTLKVPLSKVRFTQTGTAQCHSTEECMQACRDIQQYYMDLGFADIPFNFLIGGDGILYNARGWTRVADRPPAFQRLKKTCIDVAYIGSFEKEPVPYHMLGTGTDLLKLGLKLGRLTSFYQAYTFLGERLGRQDPDVASEQIPEHHNLYD